MKVKISEMLQSGVHFGHRTSFWNPKMKPYIYTKCKKIHIIDLEQTSLHLERALSFIEALVAKGGKVLFVGTKRAASNVIREQAERCNMPYICNRWLGGTLTNHKTIRKTIMLYKDLLEQQQEGVFNSFTKKEALMKQREMDRLEKAIGGIKDIEGLPDAVFVIDVKKEQIAVREACKLGMPVIGVVDTNSNPDGVDFIIPGNDDSSRSIKLYATAIANSVIQGGMKTSVNNEEILTSGTKVVIKSADEKKSESKEIPVAKKQAATEKKPAAEKKPATEKKPTAEKKPAAKKKEQSQVSAADVKALRQTTGLGMMECKKALVAADGDMAKAKEDLYRASGSKAAGKADRIAADGIVATRKLEDSVLMIEVNSETDFVARDENFKAFVEQILDSAQASTSTDIAEIMTGDLEKARQELVQKIGENIQLRRIERVEGKALGEYVHNNRIGALVALKEGTKELAKDIAVHVASMNPLIIKPADMPKAELEKERVIFEQQAVESGKPESVVAKIVEGKVAKFLNENALVEQDFVKNPEQKVKDFLGEAEVVTMLRFEVGEGIEKKEENFALEISKQLQGAE